MKRIFCITAATLTGLCLLAAIAAKLKNGRIFCK